MKRQHRLQPASTAQFDALAQLAADGLIDVNGTTVPSIAVPASVPIPFGDISARCASTGPSLRNRSGFCGHPKTAI